MLHRLGIACEAKKTLTRLKLLIKKGILELEDLTVLLQGIVHLNIKDHGNIVFMNLCGCHHISYSFQDIQSLGFNLMEMDQSECFFTQN